MEKRKLIAVNESTAQRLQIASFLLGKNKKAFASQLLDEALTPYKHWVENIKKINADSINH